MLKVRSTNSKGGPSGTIPEKPKSHHGEVGERIRKVITTTADQPQFHARKLAEDGVEVRALEELTQRFLANPNCHSRALEFVKDGSVPSSEKYMVITVPKLEKSPFGLFLLRAQSHQDAQAAARAAIKAAGLHPMACFSAHLSLALLAG
jgi:hypothetical protein